MARKKADQEPERLPNLPAVDPVQTLDETARDAITERTERDIEDILQEVGSGARVRIRRINEQTGNAAHVGEMKADEFSLESLADVYGGGAYYLYVFAGRDQIGGRIRVEIDPAIPAKNPRAPKGVPQQNGNGSADAVMAMLAASAQSQQAMMGAMGTMMQGFAGAMTAMMTARPQEKDPMEIALKMAEIMKQNTPAKTAISEIKEIMEVADLIRPGDGDGTMPLIAKGIDAVSEIVKRNPPQNPQRRVPAVTGSVNVTPATQGAVAPTPVPELPEMRPWYRAVVPRIPMLVPMIGKIAPETVADLVEQTLDDISWADLVADITETMQPGDEIIAENCLPFAERTVKAFNLDKEHEVWFAELAKECLQIANDAQEETSVEEKTDA